MIRFSKRFATGVYTSVSVALAIFLIIRGYWAAPAAPWQTNFWFINDIDRLLSGKLSEVTWFTWGGGHATNGYRWFEYLNAMLFKFDPRVEIAVYSLIVLVISLSVGHMVLRISQDFTILAISSLLMIPFVLFSFSGSWPRGMELGTFAGLAILSWFFLQLTRDKKPIVWRDSALSSITAFTLFFVFMGGYTLGVTFSLFAISIIFYKNPDFDRFRIATIAFVAVSALFAFSLRLANSGEETQGISKLAIQQAENPFFITIFLGSGPAAGLVTVQTLERFNVGLTSNIIAIITFVILIYLVFVFSRISKMKSKIRFVGPLLLIGYGFGTMFMLLLFRPYDQFQLLNPWYALHFKILIAGLLALTAIMLTGSHSAKEDFDYQRK